ncbi:MAG TPA: hypothetical protein VGM05_12080 [Planctomycetaceae bacterium]|jgi:hypothetical protein
MTIFLPALAVAFAAFCVWLTVRIVNRRERWAKWTLAATIFSIPVLYVVSFGPACWWIAKTVPEFPGGPLVGTNAAYLSKAYWPIGWVADRYPNLRPMLAAYSRALGKRTAVLLPISGSGNDGMILWLQSP